MSQPTNQPDRTVLIIDDEIFIRQSLRDYLEDHGWSVLEAESSEQALNLLKSQSPRVAIVDIRLGGMDGDDFIRHALPEKPGMAFVVYTGSPEYLLPLDLKSEPRVSDYVLRKTVSQLNEIEQELGRLIQLRQNQGIK